MNCNSSICAHVVAVLSILILSLGLGSGLPAVAVEVAIESSRIEIPTPHGFQEIEGLDDDTERLFDSMVLPGNRLLVGLISNSKTENNVTNLIKANNLFKVVFLDLYKY